RDCAVVDDGAKNAIHRITIAVAKANCSVICDADMHRVTGTVAYGNDGVERAGVYCVTGTVAEDDRVVAWGKEGSAEVHRVTSTVAEGNYIIGDIECVHRVTGTVAQGNYVVAASVAGVVDVVSVYRVTCAVA